VQGVRSVSSSIKGSPKPLVRIREDPALGGVFGFLASSYRSLSVVLERTGLIQVDIDERNLP